MHGHLGFLKYFVNFGTWLVNHEFDSIQNVEVPGAIMQVINNFLVISSSDGSDEDELGILWNFIILENLSPDS